MPPLPPKRLALPQQGSSHDRLGRSRRSLAGPGGRYLGLPRQCHGGDGGWIGQDHAGCLPGTRGGVSRALRSSERIHSAGACRQAASCACGGRSPRLTVLLQRTLARPFAPGTGESELDSAGYPCRGSGYCVFSYACGGFRTGSPSGGSGASMDRAVLSWIARACSVVPVTDIRPWLLLVEKPGALCAYEVAVVSCSVKSTPTPSITPKVPSASSTASLRMVRRCESSSTVTVERF